MTASNISPPTVAPAIKAIGVSGVVITVNCKKNNRYTCYMKYDDEIVNKLINAHISFICAVKCQAHS